MAKQKARRLFAEMRSRVILHVGSSWSLWLYGFVIESVRYWSASTGLLLLGGFHFNHRQQTDSDGHALDHIVA